MSSTLPIVHVGHSQGKGLSSCQRRPLLAFSSHPTLSFRPIAVVLPFTILFRFFPVHPLGPFVCPGTGFVVPFLLPILVLFVGWSVQSANICPFSSLQPETNAIHHVVPRITFQLSHWDIFLL